MSKLEEQVMNDLGKQLTNRLNRMFEEQYNMATTTKGAKPLDDDINTQT